jgi:glycosyltransferase involved in cell wall biosynthesis
VRILVAYNHYRQRIQGEQVAIEALVDLLQEKGHDVSVFARETVDSKASLLAKAEAAIAGIHGPRMRREMAGVLESFRPDLVHFHNLYPRLGLPALAACESRGIPTAISLHNYFLSCPIYKHFRDDRACTDCGPRNTAPCITHNCRGNVGESLVYAVRAASSAALGIRHRFDAYVAQSQFARDTFVDYGVPSDRIHVLRNFVERAPDAIVEPREARPYALFLGRMVAEKGVEDVAALARRLPDLEIRIAGGALAPLSFPWPGSVQVLGELPRSAARALLQGASCLLFPSRWFEMCPLVILEAMLARVPIVAAAIGGIPELVPHEERGLLYPPGDVAALEAQVRRLLEDANLRDTLVDNAHRYVLDAHSAQTHYEGLLRVYRQAIESRRDRGPAR